MPRAAGLADEIKKQFGIEPDLIKGKNGVFEVKLGDELIFSKKDLERFPEHGEVESQLAKKVS